MSLMMRRRMMMQENIRDTSPTIELYNTALLSDGTTEPHEYLCATRFYDVNGYKSFAYYFPLTAGVTGSTGSTRKIQMFKDDEFLSYWSASYSTLMTRNLFDGTTKIRFPLYTDTVDSSYCYTDNGDILFAGKNTEYYGMENIYD